MGRKIVGFYPFYYRKLIQTCSYNKTTLAELTEPEVRLPSYLMILQLRSLRSAAFDSHARIGRYCYLGWFDATSSIDTPKAAGDVLITIVFCAFLRGARTNLQG